METERKIDKPAKMNDNSLRFRLSAVEVLYNGAIASGSFMTPFLQTLGVGAAQLGIISSINSVAGIISQPVWGVVSDKMRSTKKCFIICLLITALLMAIVPGVAKAVAAPVAVLTILFAVMRAFDNPANQMMESWLVKVSSDSGKISYGSIRLWASIGYAVMGIAFTPILKVLPVSSTYYFYAAFALPAVILAFTVPETSREGMKKKIRLKDMPFKKLAGYWMITYIGFNVLFNLPNMWATQYFPYLITELGGGASAIATFMAVRAFCEVPMLALSGRIIRRFGLVKPMFVVAAVLVLEQTIYGLSNSMWMLFPAQIMHGLCMGLLMSCRIQYIHKLAPKNLGTTAQTFVGAVNSVAAIAFSVVGGFVYEALGSATFFFALAGLLVVAAGAFAASFPIGTKLLKKTLPEAATTQDL